MSSPQSHRTRPTRNAQLVSSGLGRHFVSPRKPRDKKKTQTVVNLPGADAKRRRLLAAMEELMTPQHQVSTSKPPSPHVLSIDNQLPDSGGDIITHDVEILDLEPEPALKAEEAQAKRRISPDQLADSLYSSWSTLIPTLVDVQLKYSARTHGKPFQNPHEVISACTLQCTSTPKRTSLICLFFDRFASVDVLSCQCSSLPQVLVYHGLFPTAPSQPRMAVSIELLSLYRALFERSCDSINALASALKTHYSRRGYQMTDAKGEVVRDPFRRGLGHAVQWFDILQIEVDSKVEAVLQRCRDRVAEFRKVQRYDKPLLNPDIRPIPPRRTADAITNITGSHAVTSPSVLHQDRCSPLLVQRCPACFGGTLYGRPSDEGGDIHVATDGNFHHRHRRSAGDCPRFYNPTYFLPKKFVDEVGRQIEVQRKRSPKARNPIVPDEAIDQCEGAYEAADGKKQKAAMDSFDDTGVMALICRHDIPLFFANIDSPGEQQKYSIALLQHLFSLLPTKATVVALYDVGCVLARSLLKYDIFPESIMSRLRFATTAMHAYGHEWACQLEYNPRMCIGLGLSDGEGTERLWSRFVRLIGVERSSSRQRRIWLIDRQAAAIGLEMRSDLGDWIKRRMKRGIKDQGTLAQEVLDQCKIPVEELRSEWKCQRQSQLSIRAHTPARLKKELDTVLALQAELDTSNRALQMTRTMFGKETTSDDTLEALESLEKGHTRLMDKVETLYMSLNLSDRFPELEGVDLNFVRTLLMARDLKINIRKRAIASFFEWDKLDRAVGGAQQTLGTKLHQQTRKAIAKRQPALMAAIRKFNSYCERLESLYDPSCRIPLPSPLPTKLTELRGDPTLMEDVWITPSVGDVPRWLEDSDVRNGIRALLKRDRCREEQNRLGIEADNLCRFFGEELAALELAIRLPESEPFMVALETRRSNFLRTQTRWTNSLASSVRFTSSVNEAIATATAIAGGSQGIIFHWVNTTTTLAVPEFEGEGEVAVFSDLDDVAPQVDAEQATLADVLEMDAIDDDEDLTDFSYDINATIVWEVPENLLLDDFRVPLQGQSLIIPGTIVTRVRPPRDGFPRQVFEPKDIQLLRSHTACLNDVCINSCAALLYSELDNRIVDCAIFSTHDLPRIRYNASDDIIWRNTSWTSYWEKEVWMLPIHRPSDIGHWVFCAIYLTRKELHLFDSLGERKPWKTDVKDIMKLIARLLAVARKHHHPVSVDLQGWVARPLNIHRLQNNGYDCGVWVLAAMIAVLRGRHVTGMHEVDIGNLRHYLSVLVLSIPSN